MRTITISKDHRKQKRAKIQRETMIEACMDDWRKRKQRESEVEHDGQT
jgi:hypothetical protein